MAKTTSELLEFIDARFGRLQNPVEQVGIEQARSLTLNRIRAVLLEGRFPNTDEERYQLSLVPFLFQEANYDGIEWGPGSTQFGHLQDFFDLDFLVAVGGRDRSEVSESETRAYWENCYRFVDRRTGQNLEFPRVGPLTTTSHLAILIAVCAVVTMAVVLLLGLLTS